MANEVDLQTTDERWSPISSSSSSSDEELHEEPKLIRFRKLAKEAQADWMETEVNLRNKIDNLETKLAKEKEENRLFSINCNSKWRKLYLENRHLIEKEDPETVPTVLSMTFGEPGELFSAYDLMKELMPGLQVEAVCLGELQVNVDLSKDNPGKL